MNKIVASIGGIRGHVWLGVLTSVRFSDGFPNSGRLALYRLNGHAWQRVAFPAPRVAPLFNTIAVASGKDVWVAVGGLLQRTTARHSGVYHFNGRTWTQLRVPRAEPAELFPVSLDHHGGIWLGPYAHWTGRRWVAAFPKNDFPGLDCFGILSFASIPGSPDLLGAGVAQRIGWPSNQFNAMTARYGRPHAGTASSTPGARPNPVTCFITPDSPAETTRSRVQATLYP